MWVESAASTAAGGIAGACGVVAGQPLDTVRIRQQAQQGAGGLGAASLARGILRAEGAGALFRGMAYPLATAALQAGGIHTWAWRNLFAASRGRHTCTQDSSRAGRRAVGQAVRHALLWMAAQQQSRPSQPSQGRPSQSRMPRAPPTPSSTPPRASSSRTCRTQWCSRPTGLPPAS